MKNNSDSESSSQEEEQQKWDEWVDESAVETKGLFNEKQFKSPELCWKNCIEEFGWDHDKIYKDWQMDELQHIQLVNYIRAQISSTPATELIASLLEKKNSETSPWRDEKYLAPIISDDPLLLSIGLKASETADWSDSEEEIQKKSTKSTTTSTGTPSTQELLERVRRLELENNRLKVLLKFDEGEEEEKIDQEIKDKTKFQNEKTESNYFECYAQFDVHSLMLRDAVRTLAYKDFCFKNPSLFKDKVVMDIGCGTGILSMFAAESGAKQVIAVDKSDIIESAKIIVKANKLEDKITFCQKNVETIEKIVLQDKTEITSIDVIISEWMGYGLLYECMLPSVLVTRDRWRARQSTPCMVYPDIASMHIQAWSDEAWYNNKLNFWSDVYGYNMSLVRNSVLREAQITVLPGTAVQDFTEPYTLRNFDINTVSIEELDFTSDFTLNVTQTKALHGFVSYFDIGFEKDCTQPIYFSTSPKCTPTHWEQVVLFLDTPMQVKEGDIIVGAFSSRRSTRDGHRDLILSLTFQIKGDDSSKRELFFLLS